MEYSFVNQMLSQGLFNVLSAGAERACGLGGVTATPFIPEQLCIPSARSGAVGIRSYSLKKNLLSLKKNLNPHPTTPSLFFVRAPVWLNIFAILNTPPLLMAVSIPKAKCCALHNGVSQQFLTWYLGGSRVPLCRFGDTYLLLMAFSHHQTEPRASILAIIMLRTRDPPDGAYNSTAFPSWPLPLFGDLDAISSTPRLPLTVNSHAHTGARLKRSDRRNVVIAQWSIAAVVPTWYLGDSRVVITG